MPEVTQFYGILSPLFISLVVIMVRVGSMTIYYISIARNRSTYKSCALCFQTEDQEIEYAFWN